MVFQFACAGEETYQWDEETTSEVLDFDTAIRSMNEFIKDLLERTGTVEPLFCFSSKPCFRYEILPTYKHNRKSEKPKLHQALQDYVRNHYKTKEKTLLEADDVMGILATISPGKYILASIDKDLLQIPGLHYNWRKDEFTEVSEEEGDMQFWTQVLTGDPTDGYRGCPGIGPVKAARILEDVPQGESPWSTIVKAYEAKGLSEEDALVQARVARILRKQDYDFKNNQPKLWVPPRTE